MTARAQRRAGRSAAIDLQDASDEVVLVMRLCDLPVQLGNSLMSRRIARLQRELAARNIVACQKSSSRPTACGVCRALLSCPPRLMRLERYQMFRHAVTSVAPLRRLNHFGH